MGALTPLVKVVIEIAAAMPVFEVRGTVIAMVAAVVWARQTTLVRVVHVAPTAAVVAVLLVGVLLLVAVLAMHMVLLVVGFPVAIAMVQQRWVVQRWVEQRRVGVRVVDLWVVVLQV